MTSRPSHPPSAPPAPVEEDTADKKMKLGADFALVIPTGDWSDFSGIGLGALLRFEYRVADNVAITARAGYIGHLAAENSTGFGTVSTSTSEMPLLFPGIKAIFGGAYVAAEIGLINFRAQEELEVDYSGDALDIGFNVTYLLDVLNNLSANKIEIRFNDGNASALFGLADDPDFKYVVMPMRI